VNVRQPKEPSGHPAMAFLFGQSVSSRPTSFVIVFGRRRNLADAVPAMQACFDDKVKRSSGAVPEWDGSRIKREHSVRVKALAGLLLQRTNFTQTILIDSQEPLGEC